MRLSNMILAALLPAAIIAIIVLPAQVAGKEVGKGAGHEWFQTVPTRTPTPAPPTVTPTALPPTVTPTAQPPTATAPPPTVTPTDAPATVTPRPGPTDTPEPGATDTPTAPPATVTGEAPAGSRGWMLSTLRRSSSHNWGISEARVAGSNSTRIFDSP